MSIGLSVRVLAILSLTVGAMLPAADFSVSEKGDDANPGTSAGRPFRTLQRADGAMAPGDTVWVMAGTYRNDLKRPGGTTSLLTLTTSGRPDAWITWRNYQNDRPELIAQGCWNAINLRASYLVIDGLTLTGNNDNVRQIDAEANAEIDVAKTMAAFAAATAAKGKHDLVADPKLVLPSTDPLRADFRLQPGSPAIDSASLDLSPKSDLAGIVRPSGATPDRGAFEYPHALP